MWRSLCCCGVALATDRPSIAAHQQTWLEEYRSMRTPRTGPKCYWDWRDDLKYWTRDNINMPAEERLQELQAANVLPSEVQQILDRCLFKVPPTGLFTIQHQRTASNSSKTVGFPRNDIVELLLKEARNGLPFVVAKICGPSKSGRSFSMPWALVETIRLIQQGDSNQAHSSYGHDGSSSSSSSSTSKHERRSISKISDNNGSSRGIERVCHILVVPCSAIDQLKVDVMQLLLAAIVFLGVPAIFDDASSWTNLPGAMLGLLEGPTGCDFRHLKFLSPQFVLLEDQKAFDTGSSKLGKLAWCEHLGIPPMMRTGTPSLDLIAGMLQTYHKDLYPSSFFKVVACSGYRLDHLVSHQPCVPWEQLSLQHLGLVTGLKDKYLRKLETFVVNGHGPTKYVSTFDSEDVRFLDTQRSCQREREGRGREKYQKVYLRSPPLIMMNGLQKAFDGNGALKDFQKLEQLAFTAEGKVLETMVRDCLLDEILERIGCAGSGYKQLYTGDLSPDCKLDFVLVLENGTVVWGCCKRQQSKQTFTAITKHLQSLARLATQKTNTFRNQLAAAKNSPRKTQILIDKYAEDTSVQLMQAVLAGRSLKFVSVSVVAAKRPHYLGHIEKLRLGYDGLLYDVPSSWHKFLFHELVRPTVAEPLQLVLPLKGSLGVKRGDWEQPYKANDCNRV